MNDDCGIKPPRSAHFYLRSLSSNAETIAGAIRSHWGIENSLHWTLDVTFCEDKSRIRKQNSPENFALQSEASHKFTETRKNFRHKV
ncbi:ISAs1 family transposase [Microcoleus sp. HI-ES]|uniref:ISAs1 family transposase n=1 Tax=Microcoleus sp. N9_B4 TaxID=3055386 RepID=UPI0022C8313C|nr:ISAs1 family transposase [Microcoleus sp. HI-ES]